MTLSGGLIPKWIKEHTAIVMMAFTLLGWVTILASDRGVALWRLDDQEKQIEAVRMRVDRVEAIAERTARMEENMKAVAENIQRLERRLFPSPKE